MERRMRQVRRIGLAIAVVVAIAASYGIVRHYGHSEEGAKSGRHVLYYVDPMHPAYKSDKPGIAPDCGMQLEPVYSDQGNAVSSDAQFPRGTVNISPDKQQLIGVRIAEAERRSDSHVERLPGRVVADERRLYRVTSASDGWVREIYPNSVGEMVKQNQPLATF